MKLNEKILYCRKKAGLSQEALAEQLGVSRQAVSKWETGDAVPEIGKLLLLAKAFDVTTDWLLSEEEPSDYSSADDYNGRYGYEPRQDRVVYSDDWIDRIPKVFRTIVRKFGWIAGVYVAVIGAITTGFGLIFKIITTKMMNSFSNSVDKATNSFFGGSFANFYGSNGNVIGSEESKILAEMFGGGSGYSTGMDVSGIMEIFKNNPISIVSTVIIFIGLILLIGGIILAVVWKKKSKA